MLVAPSKKFTTPWFGAYVAFVWLGVSTATKVYACPDVPTVLAVSVIVFVPCVTVCTSTGDVLAVKVALPPKAAVMLCEPPQKACPDANLTVAVCDEPTVPVPSTVVPS